MQGYSKWLVAGEAIKSQHSGDEEDLSQLDTDPFDLMGCEKHKTTVHFGPSLVT